MNIKITHDWLLEYLETSAAPEEIRKYLSLSGPSVERLENFKDEVVYDIEIISNRIDTASVLGVAQEAVAILPMFGKTAKLKFDPLTEYRFDKNFGGDNKLSVKIEGANLCSRFTAVVLDNVKVGPSPDFIAKRLVACGVKSINNVVDISNYLMIALGQPVHVFDYDEIKKQVMVMRESARGETIVTLDEKKVELPGGDIVIEDGDRRLIDLCGIMGGLNSSVTKKTKKVVLFVQTYNKEKIRKTVMTTGVRTLAATYFEKGLDEERVEPTMVYGVKLLAKYAGGIVSSPLYDIYPKRSVARTIATPFSKFDESIGIKIERKTVVKILENLSFKVKDIGDLLEVTVPSFRKYDVTQPQDLVEEVARVFGYEKLPNNLPPPARIEQPEEFKKLFSIIDKVKYFLKHLGLTEVINYSMVSEELLKNSGLIPQNHLKLSNTISKDIEYMRTTLIPSLLKNLKENAGKSEPLKFFEVAKVYLPKADDLPQEVYKLGVAVDTDYFDLKGIVEALKRELNIDDAPSEEIVEKDGRFLVELDVQRLIDNYRSMPVYRTINPYAVVKLDKTFKLGPELSYKVIRAKALKSKFVKKIEVIGVYENKLTLRFYYSSSVKNLTEEEAKSELAKV